MITYPDSKVYGANMGPIWGRQDPGGLHIGPMNFAIWVINSDVMRMVLVNHLRLYYDVFPGLLSIRTTEAW